MSKLKIGIVEDEMIIADSIVLMLEELGYEVAEPATRFSEGVEMVEREKPDLLLLDINLVGKLNGIDLARLIKEKYSIPYIFLTANSDVDTIERAKEVQPMAYLVKPVTKELLFSAIEIAFNNFNQTKMHPVASGSPVVPPRDFVFVKDGHQYRKLYFTQIVYLESDANYVSIHLDDKKKILVRASLPEFIDQLDDALFCRINRGLAVNIKMVETVLPGAVTLRGLTLPISKTYRDDFMKQLGIRND